MSLVTSPTQGDLKNPPWPLGVQVEMTFPGFKGPKKGMIMKSGHYYNFFYSSGKAVGSRQLFITQHRYSVKVVSTGEIWDPYY